MKPVAFDVRVATSVREAVSLLAEYGGEARPLAGGQSLIPLLNFRMAQPEALIDLGDLDELRYIRRTPDDGLHIGAMTTMSQLLNSSDVAITHPVLRDTIRYVAHEPIRNRGTIGGSLAHMDPAGEMPALALLLNCELVATSASGSRVIPAAEFIRGAYNTALGEDLLTEVRVPALRAGARGAVLEFAQRAGDFALAGAACVLTTDSANTVTSLDVVVFGASTAPARLPEVDRQAVGRPMTPELAQEVGSAYADGITPTEDRHGSGGYRRHLARVMVTRVIRQAAASS